MYGKCVVYGKCGARRGRSRTGEEGEGKLGVCNTRTPPTHAPCTLWHSQSTIAPNSSPSHIFFRNCYGVNYASTTGRALTTMMRPFRQGCARSFTVFRPYYASRCGAEYSGDQALTTACVQSDSGGEISGDQTRVRGYPKAPIIGMMIRRGWR